MIIEGGRRRFFLKDLMRATVFAWFLNIISCQPHYKHTRRLSKFLSVLAFLIFASSLSAQSIELDTAFTSLSNYNEDNANNYYQEQHRADSVSILRVSELEKQLGISESQRVEQNKVLNRKLWSVILLAIVLGVFGIISFVLFNKFKKQKETACSGQC